MKINPNPIQVKPRKPTFIEWVLGSSKAFSIVWRMALLVPCFLFTILAILSVSYHTKWYLIAPAFIFWGLAMYNLWRNRAWFKTTPEIALGKMVFGMQIEKEPGDEGYEDEPKNIDEVK
jgi:uncharacterized RDD family membrane protein YckC